MPTCSKQYSRQIFRLPCFPFSRLRFQKLCIGHGRALSFTTGETLEEDSIKTNSAFYVHLLRECVNTKALETGKSVHADIIRSGIEPDVFLHNNLINMYTKCGSLEHARHLFHKMPQRNSVSWNAIISGYAQHGDGSESFKFFTQMHREGISPTRFTFASVINACKSMEALDQALQVNAHVVKIGFGFDIFVGSAFVDIYAKLGSVDYARQMFDKMPERNVVSWNAMIGGYAQHGDIEDAMQMFWELLWAGMMPTEFTWVSVLNACSRARAFAQGKQDMLRMNVGWKLLSFIGKCHIQDRDIIKQP